MSGDASLDSIHGMLLEQAHELREHINAEEKLPLQIEQLAERVGVVEAGMRILAASNVHLTNQMTEVSISLHSTKTEVQGLAHVIKENNAAALLALDVAKDERTELRTALIANSQTTQATLDAAHQIIDVVTTASTLGKLARWAAPTFMALLVGYGLVSGWLHSAGAAAAEVVRSIRR